jgi:glycosyltransferase involved in cell wall biosynthesis
MQSRKPLRLALFGTICHTGGSSAMALFGVVEQWLRAGMQIDFFSPGNFIDPDRLANHPGFHYTAVPLASWKSAAPRAYEAVLHAKAGPAALRAAVSSALNQVQRVAHEADVVRRIRREHARAPYDAFVSMNRTSSYDLAEVMPLVSWSQGPPRCESDFIRREGSIVRRECGWKGWAILRGGYVVKDTLAAFGLHRSTGILVGSEWARSMWVRAGYPADRLYPMPFPVDVDRFHVSPRPGKKDDFVFLWLGRIVPRKRFALALEAFDKLRSRRPGARLVIAGQPGYEGLVASYHLPPLGRGAESLGLVRSSEVPALLARTDVLFQPSENENYGAGPVEALACGIPSIVGPTNGTADALGDTAFRFDRYDATSVAEAMERAMDGVTADPAGIARRSRALAEETLSMPVIARRAAIAIEHIIDRWHADRSTSAGAESPRRPSILPAHDMTAPFEDAADRASRFSTL